MLGMLLSYYVNLIKMELFHTFMEYFIIGFVSLMAYVLFVLIIQIIYMSTGLYEKLMVTIQIPKQKKFKERTTPIYELKENTYDTNFSVHKWELKYTKSDWTLLTSSLIPYPIYLERFKYVHVGSYHICERKDVDKYDMEKIIEIYEEKYKKDLEEHEKYVSDTKKRNDHLSKVNNTFNQNFI